MTAASGQWTLGVLIGLPVWGFLSLVLLGFTAFSVRYAIRNRTTGERWGYGIGGWKRWSDRRRGMVWASAAGSVLALLWMVLAFAYWPFNAAYHQYRPVHGTVTSIGNRFVGGGDAATNQLYVVTLEGSGQQYAVDDTRAALLRKGDRVSLRCIRQWDYGSNNAGSYCKWGQ